MERERGKLNKIKWASLKVQIIHVPYMYMYMAVPAHLLMDLHTCDISHNLVVAVKPLVVHTYVLVASWAGYGTYIL